MTVEVLDRFCAAKSGKDYLNEDAYVVTDEVVAVFDGETNKGQHEIPSPGRRASTTLVTAITELGGNYDPPFVVKYLHSAIARIRSEGFEPVAAGAIFIAPTRQIIRVGDITVGIDGVMDVPRKLVDEVAAGARAALLEAHLCAGRSVDNLLATDPGREMILPLLREARNWRNRTGSAFGFGAIDGRGTPADLIDVFDVPHHCEIVLATDGYLRPRPTLAESERLLQESIRLDPLRIGPQPGTKAVRPGYVSFDDRTYVRVRL